MNWHQRALCAEIDPELWFPDKGDSKSSATAKHLCQLCPVKAECLEEALTEGRDFGVWGGTTERERRALRRNMKEAAA
jgi:WhiB family redox-sensing transcriptional regulator